MNAKSVEYDRNSVLDDLIHGRVVVSDQADIFAYGQFLDPAPFHDVDQVLLLK